ncbi:porin family protein [Rudanella lutea]|uniref:porin family protein n=1 Tax=Rudanella lutea TaxID=451374 RepID=UPI00035CF15B|nr:porin family protein [Rudanella lutea]
MQKIAFFQRTLLTLSLIIIALATANAQTRQRWSLGPRLGLNLSKFSGDVIIPNNQVSDTKFLPGFSAGLGAMYSDISHFGFAIDALYSQRGARYTNGNSRQRINYIEITPTARYFLNDGGNFRPNILLGPSVNFRTGANFDPTQGSPADKFDNINSTRPYDIGITAGLQLNFRVRNRERFIIDTRFTQGLTDVMTTPGVTRNQTITIGLGYNFGVGRNYNPGDQKLPLRR